jgi:glycosyltransferase involved in cell wall biosynthesis
VVSVVVPNYNYARYLPECLDSMLAQTYPNWEAIVVDDSSTDESTAVVERYVAAWPDRFRLLRLTGGPSGTPRAINAGVSVMRGRYFSWLSSDDRAVPRKLAAYVDVLERHPRAGMVHSAYRVIGTDGQVVSVTNPPACDGAEAFFRLLQGNIVNGSAVLVRKSMLDEVGPLLENDPELRDLWRVAEYGWWLEVALRSDVIAIGAPLHDWRVHDVNTHYNTSGFGLELCEVLKRRLVRSHGLDAIADRLAGRLEGGRHAAYGRLLAILCGALRPEDLVLFAECFAREDADGRAALAAAALSLQRTDTACRVADYYSSLDQAPVDAMLPALQVKTPQTERLAMKLLDHAKAEFRAGRPEEAARLLRRIVAVSAHFPTIDLSARYYLALACEVTGDSAAALDQFAAILALEPNHVKAREGLERTRTRETAAAHQ